MSNLLTPEEDQLMAKFRTLPEPEREAIIDKAQDLMAKAFEKFIVTASNLEGFSNETKQAVIEKFFGPLNQTEEEAVAEGSAFSRSFDIALIASIVEVMKERETPHE